MRDWLALLFAFLLLVAGLGMLAYANSLDPVRVPAAQQAWK